MSELNHILVGRDQSDLNKYGEEGMGTIAKQLVGEKQESHLTTPVKIDLARPHLIGLFGKRGQGKSYTLGTIAEEMLLLDESIRKNISCVIIDTMGIYWSMKNASDDAKSLADWGLKPKGFDVVEMIPFGNDKIFKEDNISYDATFSMKVSYLNTDDWALSFNIPLDSEMGILLQKTMRELREDFRDSEYSITDIIHYIKKQNGSESAKDGLVNRFSVAEEWGIFSDKGLDIHQIARPGKVTIIDVSHFTQASGGWSVKSLVVGLLARKILDERVKSRRVEELETMDNSKGEGHMPITWMLIDEAHQFLPREGMSAASLPLLQWVKIGREPGVSLVLATQMPNKLHQEAVSQSDLVIAHRLTSSKDLDSLSSIMQTYMKYGISDYFDRLPRLKGSAIILDDNSERIIPVRIRPRMSWHAGGSPIAIKKDEDELGL